MFAIVAANHGQSLSLLLIRYFSFNSWIKDTSPVITDTLEW